MNCKFCKAADLPYADRGYDNSVSFFIVYYECSECFHNVNYYFMKDPFEYIGHAIFIDDADKSYAFRFFEWGFQGPDNKPFVVISKDKESQSKELLSLDYVPDITPDNIDIWLDRFLKIKAFS